MWSNDKLGSDVMLGLATAAFGNASLPDSSELHYILEGRLGY